MKLVVITSHIFIPCMESMRQALQSIRLHYWQELCQENSYI